MDATSKMAVTQLVPPRKSHAPRSIRSMAQKHGTNGTRGNKTRDKGIVYNGTLSSRGAGVAALFYKAMACCALRHAGTSIRRSVSPPGSSYFSHDLAAMKRTESVKSEGR